MTGVMLAIPAVNFVLHNSLFLIAHFHNVIIGGVVFGCLCGMAYWWPKAFGFRLDAFWGKVSFWFWVVGFWFAFLPLYVLGLMGVTRRVRVFDDPDLRIWFAIAAFGAVLIACGIAAMLVQFAVSIRRRNDPALRDLTGDPWNGRTLEWATSSPPPAYNFAFTPVIHGLDAWAEMKAAGAARPDAPPRAIHMPRPTGAGVVLAGLATICGLALVWYVWWLAALSFAGIVAVAIAHSFDYDRDHHITAEEVRSTEAARDSKLAQGA
jgi:cytochrome o ubiquinol oxidase subunit 1